MARKDPNPTAETLRELEATGDRLARWAAENAIVILGVIAGILVLAAGVGLWFQHASSARDAAADALAETTAEYRSAMGAEPIGGPIPEPANPQLAQRTRSEFADRYRAVAREHAGTSAAALAWLEAGQLLVALDRPAEARESFESARDAGQGSAIGALAQMRLADLAERAGDLEAAAQAFEAAAEEPSYPLRAEALAEAARCWAQAGRADQAIATFQRLEAGFPDDRIPAHIEALVDELRVAREG